MSNKNKMERNNRFLVHGEEYDYSSWNVWNRFTKMINKVFEMYDLLKKLRIEDIQAQINKLIQMYEGLKKKNPIPEHKEKLLIQSIKKFQAFEKFFVCYNRYSKSLEKILNKKDQITEISKDERFEYLDKEEQERILQIQKEIKKLENYHYRECYELELASVAVIDILEEEQKSKQLLSSEIKEKQEQIISLQKEFWDISNSGANKGDLERSWKETMCETKQLQELKELQVFYMSCDEINSSIVEKEIFK